MHVVFNNTVGAYTVQLKGASDSGSGTTFSTTDKGYKLIYMTGTDLVDIGLGMTDIVDDTTPQLGGNLDIQSYGLTSSTNIMNSTISGTGKTMILGF